MVGLIPANFQLIARTPEHVIESSELDVSSRGMVVLAGYCNDPEVFKAIEELVLHGLILGSMEARLVPLAAKSPVPIIVLEGFGRRPIGAACHKLLLSPWSAVTWLSTPKTGIC